MRSQVHVRATAAVFAATLVTTALWAFAQAQAPAPGQPSGPAAAPVDAPLPALLKDYRGVTAARLESPEPENWLPIRGTYSGWGYSPLDQVAPRNVGQLQVAWVCPLHFGRSTVSHARRACHSRHGAFDVGRRRAPVDDAHSHRAPAIPRDAPEHGLAALVDAGDDVLGALVVIVRRGARP